MLHGKTTIISLTGGLMKILSQYFPKPYELSAGNATRAGLKGAPGVDTSNLAAKSDLVSLEAELDKRDIYKLKPVPADLSKLSNVLDTAYL